MLLREESEAKEEEEKAKEDERGLTSRELPAASSISASSLQEEVARFESALFL